MIGIIDYGLGNVKAFANIYSSLSINYIVAKTPDDLSSVTHLIVPGVGSFDWAMSLLISSGFRSILDELVIQKHLPVLGVCVGMQIMASCSDEGSSPGLSWIPGSVQSIRTSDNQDLVVPHMGWNTLDYQSHLLFSGIHDPSFYFLHSYHFVPDLQSHSIATFSYIRSCCAAIANDNVFGVQFHPEKSHFNGVQLLQNFASV